jgi:hypothetical protein
MFMVFVAWRLAETYDVKSPVLNLSCPVPEAFTASGGWNVSKSLPEFGQLAISRLLGSSDLECHKVMSGKPVVVKLPTHVSAKNSPVLMDLQKRWLT